MKLPRRSCLVLVGSGILLASCSRNSSTGGDESPNELDQATLSLDDLDPARAGAVKENDWGLIVKNLAVPKAFFASNQAFNLQSGQALSLGGEDCNDIAQIDRIKAEGSTLIIEIKRDTSKCYSDSLKARGYVVQKSSVLLEGRVKIVCPGADYSELNGRSFTSLQSSGKSESIECRYEGPQRMLLSRVLKIDVEIDVKHNEGNSYSASTHSKEALFGAGEDCEIYSNSKQLDLKNCVYAKHQASQKASPGSTNSSESFDYIFKVDLSGQTAGRTSSNLDASARPLPVRLNDWSGEMTIESTGRGVMKLSDGKETRTITSY